MSSVEATNKAHQIDQTYIYEDLFDTYGTTMDLGEVAKALRRNRNALRTAISTAENSKSNKAESPEWVKKLADVKSKVGEIAIFPTRTVAELIEGGRVKQ